MQTVNHEEIKMLIEKLRGYKYLLKNNGDIEYERKYAYEFGYNRAIDKAIKEIEDIEDITNVKSTSNYELTPKEDEADEDFWKFNEIAGIWSNKCNKCCIECEETINGEETRACKHHCRNVLINDGCCGGCWYEQ